MRKNLTYLAASPIRESSIPEGEARVLVARIRGKPDHFPKTLVQEELGLSEANFPNPWNASLSATASTAVGGILPVIPFSFTRGTPAVICAAALSLLAPFGVGLAKSLGPPGPGGSAGWRCPWSP